MISKCSVAGSREDNGTSMMLSWNRKKTENSAEKDFKKRSERRQTLRAKKFHPAADPLPGGAGLPKFNQLEMVTTCTYRPSLVKIDACNFKLSW